MASERFKPDVNRKGGGVIGGYSSADAEDAASPTLIVARFDPTTRRLLVDSTLALVSSTSGGLDIYRNLDLSVTGQVIKASAGQVYGWYLFNNASSVRYLKIYNKATAPTQADTPVMTIPIPATSGANVEYNIGLEFTAGISVRATTGIADSNTDAPSTNDVVINIFYA